MKANRRPRDDPRRFGDDERGVSEAVGYIITFGISTIVLVTSLQAFGLIQGHTRSIAMDRTVEEVAAHVAIGVEEALRAGASYPDATFSLTLTIPPEVHGATYRIELYEHQVWVSGVDAQEVILNNQRAESQGARNATFVQRAGVEVLCKNPATQIEGGVCSIQSGEGRLTIVYRDPGTGNPGVYIDRMGNGLST